jgi:hypothetical protein
VCIAAACWFVLPLAVQMVLLYHLRRASDAGNAVFNSVRSDCSCTFTFQLAFKFDRSIQRVRSDSFAEIESLASHRSFDSRWLQIRCNAPWFF